MTAPRIDLVIERLVIDGAGLGPDEAADLAPRVEAALRRLVQAGGQPHAADVTLVGAKPSLGQRAEPDVLARVLAERIAAEAGIAP